MAYKKRANKVEITDKILETIGTLSGYGLSIEQVADYLKISRATFHRYMENDERVRATVELGKAKAATMVTGRAFQMAADGKHESMTKFWLQTRLRWRTEERVIHEGAIDTTGHPSTMTPEQREARIKELLNDPTLARKYGGGGSGEKGTEEC